MTSTLRRRKLEKVFGSIDVDHDGVIHDVDITALAQIWCETYDLAPRSADWNAIHQQANKMWRDMPGQLDATGTKRVTVHEWVAWGDHPEFPEFVERSAIPFSMAVFAAADKDKDGRIDRAEMMAAQTRGGMSEAETIKTFATLDTDADGYVTTDEYIQAAREFYLSDDPNAPGNGIAGDL
jgi:Ca2+-binding EF-hand superfamily protein